MAIDAVPVQAGDAADGGPAPAVRHGVSTTTVAVLGLSLTILNAMFTTCACGHYSLLSVPVALIAIWMVWSAFARPEKVSFLRRVVIAGAVVVATYGCLSMVLDFLWDGHDALFEYNQHVGAAVGHAMVRASQVSLGMLAAVALIRGSLRLAAWGMDRGHGVEGA